MNKLDWLIKVAATLYIFIYEDPYTVCKNYCQNSNSIKAKAMYQDILENSA